MEQENVKKTRKSNPNAGGKYRKHYSELEKSIIKEYARGGTNFDNVSQLANYLMRDLRSTRMMVCKYRREAKLTKEQIIKIEKERKKAADKRAQEAARTQQKPAAQQSTFKFKEGEWANPAQSTATTGEPELVVTATVPEETGEELVVNKELDMEREQPIVESPLVTEEVTKEAPDNSALVVSSTVELELLPPKLEGNKITFGLQWTIRHEQK